MTDPESGADRTPPSFGAELRRLRTARGLSLTGLSHRVNYSRSWLSRVETGRSLPNRPFAERCDDALEAGGSLLALVPDRPRGRRSFSGVPPPGRVFVGRETEADLLHDLLRSRQPDGVMVTIHGMPGVGKTALALQVAHHCAPVFPDGLLFVDAHGYDPDAAPLSLADICERLLVQLGVAAEDIPAHVIDRVGLCRQMITGRRLLMLLDDVRDGAQIESLTPPEPGNRLMVTSRRRLVTFDEAVALDLPVLAPSASARLFGDMTGADDTPTVPAVDEIVRWCGGLPLAVRIVAARCRGADPGTVADIARGLGRQHTRLAELDDGERSASAAFAVSYAGLTPPLRRLLTLVSLHGGAAVDRFAAAALVDADPDAAGRLLTQLRGANLLLRTADGRFTLHDLVRAFAAERGRAEIGEAERDRALDRLAAHYIAGAEAADRIITPHRYRVTEPAGGNGPPRDHDEAMRWLRREHDNLVGMCRVLGATGRDDRCWRLAYLLHGYFFLTKAWPAWIETHQVALAAARRAGDHQAVARTLNNLGTALMETGATDDARNRFDEARRIHAELGDDHGLADALANEGWLHQDTGRHRAALARLGPAYAGYLQLDAHRNAAITLRGIGLSLAALGRTAAAVDRLRRAHRTFEELDTRLDIAMSLNALGEAHLAADDLAPAEEHLNRAVEAGRRCGSTFEEARARENLGVARQRAGDEPGARECWRAALDLLNGLPGRAADRLRGRLGPG